MAVGFEHWMFVGKEVEAGADHEEVKEPFVNQLQLGVRFGRARVGDAELKAERLGRFDPPGRNREFDRVFDGVRQTGHQPHAAAGTLARSLGVDVAIHGADEVDIRLLGEEGGKSEDGAASHSSIMKRVQRARRR